MSKKKHSSEEALAGQVFYFAKNLTFLFWINKTSTKIDILGRKCYTISLVKLKKGKER